MILNCLKEVSRKNPTLLNLFGATPDKTTELEVAAIDSLHVSYNLLIRQLWSPGQPTTTIE